MIQAVGGMFILGIMSISSYIFAWTWLDIENGGANVECTFEKRDYSQFYGIIQNMTDLQSCVENMPAAFDAIDLNGDNWISQCEDAQLIYNAGASEEYAIKFGGAITKPALTAYCYQQFKF